MSRVINMKTGKAMAPAPLTDDELHRAAWNQLLDALVVIEKEARKPGFAKKCFTAADGGTYSMQALLRYVDRRINVVRAAVAPITPSHKGDIYNGF